jgi:probable metal-binding protein
LLFFGFGLEIDFTGFPLLGDLDDDGIAIHGHEIICLVANYPDGIRLRQLMEVVNERFGKAVTFHTGSAMGMDFEGVLRLLEVRAKVRIKSGVVYPGGSPACEH